MRVRSCAVAAMAAAAVGSAPAEAATLSRDGSTLVYTAGARELNDVRVVFVDDGTLFGTVGISDGSAPIRATEGCAELTGRGGVYSCGPIDAVSVDLGSRDDALAVEIALPVTVSGGDGDDRLQTGDGPDVLDGGAGADVLTGGGDQDTVTYASRKNRVLADTSGDPDDGAPGEDDAIGSDVENLIGGAGNDRLVVTWFGEAVGGPGADALRSDGYATLRGGAGNDVLDVRPSGGLAHGGAGADKLTGAGFNSRVSYEGRSAAVSVTQEGKANDGAVGEGDDVTGFDQVTGGDGPDLLVGTDGRDRLDGGPGDDRLEGRADLDTLVGGPGADVLSGGDGFRDTADYADRTEDLELSLDAAANDGAPGERDAILGDVEGLSGGSGNDALRGSDRLDRIEYFDGGAGDDVVDGGLGPDLMGGGRGFDTLDYSARTAAVFTRTSSVCDSGGQGEDDCLNGDFERVLGGTGDDVLNGAGDDHGMTLVGGDGNDFLRGSYAGADVLVGGDGDDQLNSQDDYADDNACGDGTDTARADGYDASSADCEEVTG